MPSARCSSDFAAHSAVAVDHLRGHAGEFGLQSVGVDDSAAEKVARASADRGEALGEEASSARFGDGDGGVAHLEPVTDDLLERFAVAGVDGVVQFVFDDSCDFVDAALAGFLRGGARFEVEFDFSGAGEDGGLHVGVTLVDGGDARIDGGLAEHGDLQGADGEKCGRKFGVEALAHFGFEDGFEFVRRAGEQHDDVFAAVELSAEQLSGSGAVRIQKDGGALENVGLLRVVGGHLPAALGETLLQAGKNFGIAPQIQAQGLRRRPRG